jgi:cell fate regulator YaaT (PSP1 superfamily)
MANYIVRYGAMRLLGIFPPTADQPYPRGVPVIVRTERGLEAGEVLGEVATEAAAGPEAPKPGQILRPMTADDKNELSRMHAQEREEFQTCLKCIEKLGLQMQLVDVEHVFGGERVIVYYLAEGRVDFRELVKMLAGEFQTRIEMRQIGVRDEAKLLADFGDCGKAVCCNTHLVQIPPVSMKMAKLQKATLDPSKISGRCGRLKCCLRYEFDMYERIQKEMPPIGSRIELREGRVRVVGHEILTGQVMVESEDHHRRLVSLTDISPPSNESGGPAAQSIPTPLENDE